MRQRFALLAAAVVVAVFAMSSTAASSSLIYGCSSHESPGGRICGIDPIGQGRRVLPAGGNTQYAVISGSSDGARLAFTDISTALFSVGSDGADLVPLVSADPPPHILYAAMSPNGSRVAYVTFEDQPQTRTPVLWTVGSDGSDRRRIGSSLTAPGWFGDRLIAVPVAGNAETGDRVCIIDEAQGSCLRAIAELRGGKLGGNYARPVVSPDGRLVAVYSETPDGTLNGRFLGPRAFVYKTATGKLLGPVYGSGLVTDGLAWSPDGRAIAFTEAGHLYVSRRPPGKDLYVATQGASGLAAWTGAAGRRPAKLRITRATVKGRTLVVRGTLAERARASVRAEFSSPSTGYPSQVFTVKASKGRIAFKRRLTHRESALSGRCNLTLAFAGDTRYGWAFVRGARGLRACGPPSSHVP
jgi:hypothetical protein